ncbi:MAG: hypothetical protein OEZ34_11645, partial [Spirochaetia bacterium]|nr:hypothetical protein [Spirochaetia bacterium]
MFKKPIIKILTFIFTIFWTFPVFSELFENKISRKRCKYSLIHPHSSLFKGNAEKDTGFQLDRSNFKKLILQKKLWNQYTFDGVIPETSIYLKSNCISNGSIRNNTAVYLIERFSGKTIHLKEVYLPSRKLIQIIPSKKLRPGSAYIYVLKSKTSKIKIKKN